MTWVHQWTSGLPTIRQQQSAERASLRPSAGFAAGQARVGLQPKFPDDWLQLSRRDRRRAGAAIRQFARPCAAFGAIVLVSEQIAPKYVKY